MLQFSKERFRLSRNAGGDVIRAFDAAGCFADSLDTAQTGTPGLKDRVGGAHPN
jgi:hypothetical protein